MWKMLAAPVAGMIIGYCTNWLAVKMLFRPRKEKYIGRFKIPFTPGVIPKGKKRLAKAVGEVINEQLLTEEAVEQRLLAPEMTYMIKTSVNERLSIMKSDKTKTLGNLLSDVLTLSDSEAENKENNADSESEGLTSQLRALSEISVYDSDSERQFHTKVAELKEYITKRIYERVKNAGLGTIAADTVSGKLSEALSGSFLGQMMGGSVTQMVGPAIAQTVDGYIAENGENLIRNMVNDEADAILNMPAERLLEEIEKTGVDIGEKAAQLYVSIVKKKSGELLKLMNAGDIARQAVENMENEQLEKLVMSTMKTELSAIVNLGALIGLVLGLINMLIYIL
jgi:uncharacterized membrane protein YheB (UPF0754 family)